MDTPSKQYKKIRKDIAYIKDNYGEIYDYCGGWCNNDKFKELLDSPNYKTAVGIYRSILEKYFREGYEVYKYTNVLYDPLPIGQDKKLQEIKERWNIL